MKQFQSNRLQLVCLFNITIEINVRCFFLVPGIGKKYGQLLADHGFIYARQLLGYYLMLKDNEMFRKWLEYKFHIPRFRAAESKKIS
jgi:hypothetical protein